MVLVLLTKRSGDQVKWNEMGGACGTVGERRGTSRVLVGKPEGKRPLGRQKRRWENNTEVDFQKVGRGAWTGLIWLRIGTVGGLF